MNTNISIFPLCLGDQPVAKVCGNLTKDHITVASSYPSQKIGRAHV